MKKFILALTTATTTLLSPAHAAITPATINLSSNIFSCGADDDCCDDCCPSGHHWFWGPSKAEKAMVQAVMDGNLEALQQALAEKADPNFILASQSEISILILAATLGELPIVDALVKAGADPLYITAEGYSPIGFASAFDRTDIVSYFLDSGVPVDLNNGGLTPLLCATAGNNTASIQLLLARGAQPNVAGKMGHASAHVASETDFVEGLQLLAAAGANLNQTANDGATPLMLAALGNAGEAVNYLIACGVDVNAVADGGDTALIIAVANGADAQTVRALIAAGADLNIKNAQGLTALMHARLNGYYEIIRILKAAGARG